MAIEYRVLGKSGLRVSTLGLGGSEIVSQAVAQKTVDKILDTAFYAGINVIDTPSVTPRARCWSARR